MAVSRPTDIVCFDLMRFHVAGQRGADKKSVIVVMRAGFVVIVMKTELSCVAERPPILNVNVRYTDILIAPVEHGIQLTVCFLL